MPERLAGRSPLMMSIRFISSRGPVDWPKPRWLRMHESPRLAGGFVTTIWKRYSAWCCHPTSRWGSCPYRTSEEARYVRGEALTHSCIHPCIIQDDRGGPDPHISREDSSRGGRPSRDGRRARRARDEPHGKSVP